MFIFLNLSLICCKIIKKAMKQQLKYFKVFFFIKITQHYSKTFLFINSSLKIENTHYYFNLTINIF